MRVFPAPAESVLRGCLADQSALIGVITRLQHGGIEVRGIRSLGSGTDARLRTEPTETVLQGPVPDQAALIRIIYRLQGWGIDLCGLRRLDPGDAPGGGGVCQVGEVASGAPHYQIRVAGRIGPVVTTCLRGLGVTVQFETTAAGVTQDRVEQPGRPDGAQGRCPAPNRQGSARPSWAVATPEARTLPKHPEGPCTPPVTGPY